MANRVFQPKDGQYYYRPHRSSWGVWMAGVTCNGSRTDKFIKDYPTKEEANETVRKLNGWTEY